MGKDKGVRDSEGVSSSSRGGGDEAMSKGARMQTQTHSHACLRGEGEGEVDEAAALALSQWRDEVGEEGETPPSSPPPGG